MSAIRDDERSLGQLFSELAEETRTLLRQEIDLAKTEMSEKAAFAGKNAGFAAAGGLVILMGALPVIAGIVIALGHAIGYATSAFIVGIVLIVIGAVLTMKALKAFKSQSLAPVKTQRQLKETKEWAKEQIR
ncbi:MAG TPA: phage holin family protein [Thermoanaerobaculia bacterium]|nr:phage holin family protein [Thermoanaerobaculia bacterium]